MEGFNKNYADHTLHRITWFTKKRGKFVGEEELKGLDLMDLRQIFGITDLFILPDGVCEDEAYEDGYDPYMVSFVYDVDEEKAKALQKYVIHRICVDKYDYEVGARRRSSSKED